MNVQMPIIRLEVSGMQHTIATALRDHVAQIDEDIQRGIAEFCTPEHIGEIVVAQTKIQMAKAVQDEIERFFAYGNGREAIRDAIQGAILKSMSDEMSGE